MSSSYNKHARPLRRRAKEERRSRCVQGEPFSVRADVAYLRTLRRRFAPARVKSVLLPVPREIPLDMYSAHISLVSCRIYAPFLFPVSTQLCILIGARGLLSRWFIDRGVEAFRSTQLCDFNWEHVFMEVARGRDVAVIMKLILSFLDFF